MSSLARIGSINLPKAYVTGTCQEDVREHDLTVDTLHIGKKAVFRVRELILEGKVRFCITKAAKGDLTQLLYGVPTGSILYTLEPCTTKTIESPKRFEELVDKCMILTWENGKLTSYPGIPGGKAGEKCAHLFKAVQGEEAVPLNPITVTRLHDPKEADSPATLKSFSHLFNSSRSLSPQSAGARLAAAAGEAERKADFAEISVSARATPVQSAAAPLKPLAAAAAAAKPSVQTQRLPLTSHNSNTAA